MESLVNYNSDDDSENEDISGGINFSSLPAPSSNGIKRKKEKKHKKLKKDKADKLDDESQAKRIKNDAKANSKELKSLLPAPNFADPIFTQSPALAYKASVQNHAAVVTPSLSQPVMPTFQSSSFSFAIDAAPGAKPFVRKSFMLQPVDSEEALQGPVAGPQVLAAICDCFDTCTHVL